MDPTKRVFNASEILEQPGLLDMHQSSYVMIYDASVNLTFHKLFDAMELLRTARTWRLVNMTSAADYTMFAVYERVE